MPSCPAAIRSPIRISGKWYQDATDRDRRPATSLGGLLPNGAGRAGAQEEADGCGSRVQLGDVGQVEADDIGRVPGPGLVDEEPDALAGADAAEPFGDDVGIAEGVGDAGLVVTDQVGTRLGAGPGRVAGDVAEPLACAVTARGGGAAVMGAGVFMSGVLGAAEADDAARAAAAVGALGGCLHGPVGVVERAAADDGLVTVVQDGGRSIPTRCRPVPGRRTGRCCPGGRRQARAAPRRAARGRVPPATPHR